MLVILRQNAEFCGCVPGTHDRKNGEAMAQRKNSFTASKEEIRPFIPPRPPHRDSYKSRQSKRILKQSTPLWWAYSKASLALPAGQTS